MPEGIQMNYKRVCVLERTDRKDNNPLIHLSIYIIEYMIYIYQKLTRIVEFVELDKTNIFLFLDPKIRSSLSLSVSHTGYSPPYWPKSGSLGDRYCATRVHSLLRQLGEESAVCLKNYWRKFGVTGRWVQQRRCTKRDDALVCALVVRRRHTRHPPWEWGYWGGSQLANTYKDRSYGGSDHTLLRKFSEDRSSWTVRERERKREGEGKRERERETLANCRKDEQAAGDSGISRRFRDGCAHVGR